MTKRIAISGAELGPRKGNKIGDTMTVQWKVDCGCPLGLCTHAETLTWDGKRWRKS